MARSKCSRTGENRYPSRLESDLAIADIQRSSSHHRHRKYRDEPTRSVECDHCGGWHLTRQPELGQLTA